MEHIQEESKRLSVKESSLFFIFTLGVYFVLSLILSTLLSVKMPKGSTLNSYYGKNIWFTCLNYGLFSISFIIVFLVYGKFDKKIYPCVLERETLHVKYVPFILAFTISLIFGFAHANDFFIKFLEKKTSYVTPTTVLPDFSIINFILCTIFIAILPAICEELLFRKIIFESLHEYSVLARVLISACLFAFFHMNPAQTIYQFVFGCVFALTVILTRSDLSNILMHFLNNFFILVIYYGKIEFNKVATIIFTTIGIILAIICTTFALIHIIKRKERKQKLNKELLYLLMPFGLCLILWLVQL